MLFFSIDMKKFRQFLEQQQEESRPIFSYDNKSLYYESDLENAGFKYVEKDPLGTHHVPVYYFEGQDRQSSLSIPINQVIYGKSPTSRPVLPANVPNHRKLSSHCFVLAQKKSDSSYYALKYLPHNQVVWIGQDQQKGMMSLSEMERQFSIIEDQHGFPQMFCGKEMEIGRWLDSFQGKQHELDTDKTIDSHQASRKLTQEEEAEDAHENENNEEEEKEYRRKRNEVYVKNLEIEQIKNELKVNEKYRIPEHRVTPFVYRIERRFGSLLVAQKNIRQDNPNDKSIFPGIVVNALAGTGKTTTLRHLYSYYQPGQKWLYLVFNKKNQVEATEKFDSNIDIMTTHSFLGKLLNANRSVIPFTKIVTTGPRRVKGRVFFNTSLKDKLIEHLIPASWPQLNSSLMITDKKDKTKLISPLNLSAKKLVSQLVSLAKAYALPHHFLFPPEKQKEVELDTKQKLLSIAEKHGLSFDISDSVYQIKDENVLNKLKDEAIDYAYRILGYSIPEYQPEELVKVSGRKMLMREHDDTLWYAAIYADKLIWPKYDVVLIDEVQDFNVCQIIMTRKLKEQGAIVVAVGDPNQSIYFFRGADDEAFQKITDLVSGTRTKYSLPINFRSGGKILEWVRHNSDVKNIRPAPENAEKGRVYAANNGTDPAVTFDEFVKKIKDEINKKEKISAAIISRTNTPLLSAAIYLMRKDVPFIIVGRDLQIELSEFIREVYKYIQYKREKSGSNPPGSYKSISIREFADELHQYENVLNIRQRKARTQNQFDMIKKSIANANFMNKMLDYLSDLAMVSGKPGVDYMDETGKALKTLDDLSSFIRRRFASALDEGNTSSYYSYEVQKDKNIVLTTAHKSKGLEWDRVSILNAEEFSTEKSNVVNEAQKQQERNCWYVAITRPRDELYIMHTEEEDYEKMV